MIEITPEAQEYFKRLLTQQDEAGLGLRISVHHPGTPHAGCDLQFCPEGTHQADDRVIELPAFNLFVAADSERWLEKASIDFDTDSTGGQLTIKAPGIRGHEPASDAPVEERVEWLLETEINPALASHGGRVALVEITRDMKVVLQFGGGCHGCGMADVTLKQGIEKTLTQKIPEITAVVDATDHETGQNPYYAPGAQGHSAV
ncbi:NifU family protein [Elongatibacter sediminis]|uniref:Fe/S biogenesis protein NfuA n=1 Tax=Elongatibacter sediminis TaxID=3119006 RepID=A0AAW9RED6_9GAMM